MAHCPGGWESEGLVLIRGSHCFSHCEKQKDEQAGAEERKHGCSDFVTTCSILLLLLEEEEETGSIYTGLAALELTM